MPTIEDTDEQPELGTSRKLAILTSFILYKTRLKANGVNLGPKNNLGSRLGRTREFGGEMRFG
jgi:hypothetical protein